MMETSETQSTQPLLPGRQVLCREFLRVVMGFLALFLLTSSGFDTSEGMYHYPLAVRLVREGSISQPEEWGEHYLFKTAPNGHRYCVHEFGNVLFAVPVAAVQVAVETLAGGRLAPEHRRHMECLFMAILPVVYQALCAGFFFLMLRTVFDQTTRRAFFGTLLMALTTYFWTYSRNLFDGVLGGMLLTASLWLLFLHGRTGRTRWLVLSATFLGFGIITRTTIVLALAAVTVQLWRISPGDRRRFFQLMTVFGLTLVPFLAWQLFYNRLRTGSPFALPVTGYENNSLAGPWFRGLAGLLFSPGKSLFLFAPVFLLSILVLPGMWRRHPAEIASVSVLVLLWLGLHAKLVSWYGAWGWGPRHFATIVPLLALPWAASLGLPGRSLARKLSWPLAGFGFLLAVSSLVGNWHYRLMLLTRDGTNTIDNWERSQVPDMFRGVWDNAAHILADQPAGLVSGASSLNQYASTTVNVWLNTATHVGLPLPVSLGIGLGLLFLVASSWLPLLRSPAVPAENSPAG
jgi:hypothetical protein